MQAEGTKTPHSDDEDSALSSAEERNVKRLKGLGYQFRQSDEKLALLTSLKDAVEVLRGVLTACEQWITTDVVLPVGATVAECRAAAVRTSNRRAYLKRGMMDIQIGLMNVRRAIHNSDVW